MTFKLAPAVLASALALSSTCASAQGHHRSQHRGYNPGALDMPRGNAPAGAPARIVPGHGGYNSGWLDDSNLYGGSPD
jgi:hypothetical protein